MQIQLENWKVSEISFSESDKLNQKKENSFSLKTGNVFSDDEKKIFGVLFYIEILDIMYSLNIKAVFNFKLVDEEITEEFKLSDFPKINQI